MGKKPQPAKKANPGQSITRFFDKTATQACKQQQSVSTAAPAGPDSTRTAAPTSAAAPTAQRQQPGAGPVVSAAAQPTNVAATVAPKLSAKQAVKAKRATGSSGATRDSSSKHVKTAAAAGPIQHKHGDKKKPHKPLQGQQTSNQQQHASGVVNMQVQSAQQQGAVVDGSARALPKARATTAPSAATVQQDDTKATVRTSALQAYHQQQQARRCSSDQAGSLKAAAMAAPAARGQAAADAVVAGVRSTASTDKPKATAAAATAPRPSRFNPYVSGQHTGMLMSQADEDMEVAWRPSPPKDLEILLQQQQQQQHVTTNSGTATSAAATTNGATPSDTHGVTQPGGSAKSSSGLGQQQQLAPAAAAAMAAAAASSADEVLEKLLDSLSDNPQQQQQQQHVDQLVMSTPGGPRLRAFRNHSVVPPSTGNKPTGRHQSYIRPGSAAAPGTAGGSSSGTHQHNSSNGSSTVKRKQAGLKRRDLFDLLDRVEGLVKRRRASGDELPASADDTDLGMMDVQATDDEHSMRDAVNSKVGLEAAGDQAAVDDGDAVVDDILAELEADRMNMHKSRYSQQQQRPDGTPMQGAKQQTGVLGLRSSRLSHVIDQQQQQQQCLTPATGPAKVTSLHGEDCQHAAAAAGSDDSADTPQQQLRGVESAATQAAHETVAAVAIESDGADCVPDTPAGDDHAAAVAAVAESSVPVTIAADTRVEATSNTESPAIAVSTQRKEHEHAVGYESAAVKQAAPSSTSPSCQVVEAATAGSAAAAAAVHKLEGKANDAEHVVAPEQSVAECTQGAAAVAANDCGASSQEARAAIAAKELAEFELLYGFDDADDEVNRNSDAVQQAPTTEVQQQQLGQQRQQQVDDTQPAHKRQRVSQPSNDPAAAAVNLCTAQAMQHQLAAAAATGDVGLAGGRADVYHIIQEVHQDMTDTHLRCFNPYKGCELHVHLSHPWNDCPIAVGDAANIIGGTTSTDEQGRAHVYLDYQHGLFVMHPDVLLSGTSITTALTCTRRAWLSERFAAAGGGPSAAALRGTLLHELLQRLLVEVVGDDSGTPLPGLQQLQQMVVDVLDDFGEKLQEVGLTEKTAAAEMNKHLENISAWLRKYLPQPQQQQQQQQSWQGIQQQQQQHVKSASGGWRGGSGRSNSGFDSSSNAYGSVVDAGPNNGLDQPPRVLIQGVADIEENIWAPRYGLKGQIDASLLVSLTRRQPASAANTGQWGGSGYQQQQQHGQRSWKARLSTGQQGSAAGRFSNHSGHQVLGSGWSVAGFSSGGGVYHGGASGAGGSSASGRGVSGFSQRQPQNPSCGGVFGNVGYSRAPGWQQPQQQQQRDAAGVLQQLDMNAAGGLQQGNVFSQPATAAAGGTDVCGVAGPVSAAGGGGVEAVDEQLRVFKGKLSGAVAASRAVQQSRAAGQNIPHQQRHQHQQLSVTGANSSGGAAAVSNAWMGSSGGGRHILANHQQQQQQQQSCDTELLIMPFEFKSGKDYFSHRAQVSLYLLLMEARYQLGLLPAGLLWNVNSPNMALVPAKQEEIAPLLACRNRLAVHLWQDSPLPPQVLGDAHTCSRCHSASTCAAVHAVVEHGTASSSGMSEAQWDSLAGAVTAAAAAWGCKWLNCIDWEEAAGRNRRAELWAMTGAQRQAKGNCIAGLQYVCSHPVKASATQGSADKVYMYTFRQVTGSSISSRSSDDDRSNAAVLEEPEQQQNDFADLTAVVDPVDAVVAECISKSQRHAGSSSSSNGQAISSGRSSSTGSLAGMPVAPGDVLILGVDGVQVNVGRVEVAELDGTVITVASQKALQLERYLAAQPLSAAAAGDGNDSAAADGNKNATVTWRLDRDEAASTAMFQRANVLRVASDSSSSRVIRLRQLLIDLEPPQQVRHEGEEQQAVMQFDQPQAAGEAGQEQQQHEQAATPAAAAAVAGYVRPVARMAMAAGERYLAQHDVKLNGDQVAVVKRVVQMQDYSLVLGMPGTGKTSTIVHAIRALASAGASILVTSYTNSALDNILLKLVECGVHDFLRLGRASSCHAGVRDYMPGSQRYPQRSTSELQQLAASTPIVGCPCLSVHHPLLAARPPFDVVIVDEAGQISLPAVLGALLKARSFVLVGDHYQLPPLVLDKRAAEGGLSVSLFRQLCEAHPGAVVVLKWQYRMCRPIMGLANELVYGGQLEAGSEQVEQAQLHLPAPDALHQLPDWVSSLLQPSCRLCFINTDSIKPAALAADSLAASGSGGVVNAGEAKVVMQLLDGLLAAGVPGAEIGVISPYKAQVALLQQLLDSRSQSIAGSSSSSKQDHAASQAAAVEVMTIDKCQGRDKDVLLLSFVRSNAKGAVGNLLNDWQRLNVALTRAKVKLLMVGSARTLGGGVPLLQKMIDWVQQRQGLVSLPQDALQH